jgi:hypothetical protein
MKIERVLDRDAKVLVNSQLPSVRPVSPLRMLGNWALGVGSNRTTLLQPS